MKTTVEIPGQLFRKAKAAASRSGRSLRTYVSEALSEKLSRSRSTAQSGWPVAPPKVSRKALREVQAVIQAEFSTVRSEEWV